MAETEMKKENKGKKVPKASNKSLQQEKENAQSRILKAIIRLNKAYNRRNN
jgi:hypothetical protein